MTYVFCGGKSGSGIYEGSYVQPQYYTVHICQNDCQASVFCQLQTKISYCQLYRPRESSNARNFGKLEQKPRRRRRLNCGPGSLSQLYTILNFPFLLLLPHIHQTVHMQQDLIVVHDICVSLSIDQTYSQLQIKSLVT